MTDDSIELNDEVFSELVTLAGAMREDTIEDIEVVRLDQLLADCPGAVEVYTELAMLSADLHELHDLHETALPGPPITATEPPRC